MSDPGSPTNPTRHGEILIWIPRISGFFSILGSLVIINLIIGNRRNRRENLKRVLNRLVLMISFIDIPVSIALVLTTIAVPPEDGQEERNKQYALTGNRASCVAQGFFIQLGTAIPLYTAILCIFYLCLLRFEMTEHTFSKRIEPFAHAICFLFPLASSVFSAISGSFNQLGVYCWFSHYPRGCQNDAEIECTRGQNSDLHSALFSVIPIFVAFLCVVISMILIVLFVNRLSTQSTSTLVYEQKETVTQASLFIATFLLTYTFHVVHAIMIIITGNKMFYIIAYFHFSLYPLQGFCNALVYCRPIIGQLRKINPGKSIAWAMKILLFSPQRISSNINPSSNDQPITSDVVELNMIIADTQGTCVSSLSTPTI